MLQTRKESIKLYESVIKDNDIQTMRELCLKDLFFLFVMICGRTDGNNDFVFSRCRDVQNEPDGNLDLWPREHFKSSLITFCKTIQDILINSDETIGIFSHTRPIAKKFLYQIKTELETNQLLKDLFPDILYQNPEKESLKWSLDGGIVVKRKQNPKEATVEAWGLVDGQPTGSHFSIMVYDDVVTRESVTSQEMIEKTNSAWSLSLNLGARINGKPGRKRYVGTRYHLNDTYKKIISVKEAKARIFYPTDLGSEDVDVVGNPVLISREELIKKRNADLYMYCTQMLNNPKANRSMGFNLEWVEYYSVLRNNIGWNYYLIVDPASSKKQNSDFTVMLVVALGNDNNYYLVDGLRDRLNLTERAKKLIALHRKWSPNLTGYERYGMMGDIEHIKYVQEQEGYRFTIVELGGQMSKTDRIRRLVPLFESRRFYFPYRLLYSKSDGSAGDLVADLISEYVDFPVMSHDDGLDCLARICDEALGARFPKIDSKLPIVNDVTSNDDYDVLGNNKSTGKKINDVGLVDLRSMLRSK